MSTNQLLPETWELSDSGAPVDSPAASHNDAAGEQTDAEFDPEELFIFPGKQVSSERKRQTRDHICNILETAAISGDFSTVRFLVERFKDQNAVFFSSMAPEIMYIPLQAAAKAGQTAIVEFFLDSGADLRPNRRSRSLDGTTALIDAVRNGHAETVLLLLRRGANVHEPAQNQITPLQAARKYSQDAIVNILVAYGAEGDQTAALQEAASKGDLTSLQILLDNGEDIDGISSGISALQAAARAEQQDAFELLLDRGASPECFLSKLNRESKGLWFQVILDRHPKYLTSTDTSGRTLLHQAAMGNYVAGIDYLLAHGADCQRPDFDGLTPIHISIKNNHIEAFERLLSKIPDMKAQDAANSPLNFALRQQPVCQRFVRALLSRGAPVTGIPANTWRTAFSYKSAKDICLTDVNGRYFVEAISRLSPLFVVDFWRSIQITPIENRKIYLLHNSSGSDPHPWRPPVDWVCYVANGPENWVHYPGILGFTQLTEVPREQLFIRCSLRLEYLQLSTGNEQDQNTFHVKTTYHYVSWIMDRREDWGPSSHKLPKNTEAHSLCRMLAKSKNPPASKSPMSPSNAANNHREILRSMIYFSTLSSGWVPDDPEELIRILVQELEEQWDRICEQAGRFLNDRRVEVLEAEGKNPRLIRNLLQDGLKWSDFDLALVRQVKVLEGVLSDYSTHEYLRQELSSPSAIDGLSRTVSDFNLGVRSNIAPLTRVTQELISLEFNLVSIYEAQRSTTMAASMKRLSWMTFIFLPLMFASSIFGANLDAISKNADNPRWWWMVVVALLLWSVTFIGWLLFKYTKLEETFESFGQYLGRLPQK